MIAVLTPVLGRAHQIPLLAKNLRAATTNPYRLVTICSPGDEAIEACEKHADLALVVPWLPAAADYAKKLAYGYMHVDEEWIFQSATDLIFHAGWDIEAFNAGRRARGSCGVIGTNDLGNPLVKRGRHSTHSLIARAYLDKWGGVADGSGIIFSEAYDHQWCDNEFIETAILRREFVFARRSIVEHMHPHWKKGEMDPTYEKAMRRTSRDMTTFTRRRGKIARLVQEQKRTKR